MNTWVNLAKIFPEITGFHIHVVNTSGEELAQKLTELGFKIYRINGALTVDEKTFFYEVKSILEFPSYYGYGWAGWDDCLGDFGHLAPHRTAIVWENSNQAFAADAQMFLKAIYDLNDLSTNAALGLFSKDSERKQIEVFISK